MSPLAVAVTLELFGVAALMLMFGLFRGPESGPGIHRRRPKHRAHKNGPAPTRSRWEPAPSIYPPAAGVDQL